MSNRKERERARRDELILDAARALLLERGYLGLTMDRIAKATEYSKGTIYQHYSCKEDVVIALAIQTAEKRSAMFDRAATFRGRTRERMLAVGVAAQLFVNRYPDHFKSEQVARMQSLRDKTSPERLHRLQQCELRCMSIASGIVRDAVAQGDLVLPEGTTPQELTWGLWAMSFGHMTVVANDLFVLDDLGIPDPPLALVRNQHVLLDGYGWRPLYSEWDYRASQQRVLDELFADISASAGVQ
jgi:AcrR family transcriptional regulator